MLVYIQSLIAIATGIFASFTDFKDKKIYNKTVILSVALSGLIYAFFWRQIQFEYLRNYILNLLIGIIISFLFFYFKIWAAGDAKLFLALLITIPFEIYEVSTANFFPGIYLLIIIFTVAFAYVVVETIYLWIKDKEKFKMFKDKKIDVKEFLINYFLGYFIVLFINNIILKYFYEFRINNGALVLLCNMLILTFVYMVIKERKHTIIISAIFLLANIIYYILFGFQMYSINFKMFVLVLIIMAFRDIAEKYNYEEIRIEDLKPRMILSYGSVLNFYGSRVKGLPQSTTESTDSRLTLDEVESIKRWSKSKKGKETIVIVKHMPFAPFILCGELIFFIVKLYM